MTERPRRACEYQPARRNSRPELSTVIPLVRSFLEPGLATLGESNDLRKLSVDLGPTTIREAVFQDRWNLVGQRFISIVGACQLLQIERTVVATSVLRHQILEVQEQGRIGIVERNVFIDLFGHL